MSFGAAILRRCYSGVNPLGFSRQDPFLHIHHEDLHPAQACLTGRSTSPGIDRRQMAGPQRRAKHAGGISQRRDAGRPLPENGPPLPVSPWAGHDLAWTDESATPKTGNFPHPMIPVTIRAAPLARRSIPGTAGGPAGTPRQRIFDSAGHRPERHGASLPGDTTHSQPEQLGSPDERTSRDLHGIMVGDGRRPAGKSMRAAQRRPVSRPGAGGAGAWPRSDSWRATS
ncbi:hypothetical protein GCM10010381_54900 [Streptomyces xantholiticus]|nr:hypothetical protein GCM10010381_54900 [Streptomyces xantholiticus]